MTLYYHWGNWFKRSFIVILQMHNYDVTIKKKTEKHVLNYLATNLEENNEH